MKKKETYIVPAMKVLVIQAVNQMLAGSNETPSDEDLAIPLRRAQWGAPFA